MKLKHLPLARVTEKTPEKEQKIKRFGIGRREGKKKPQNGTTKTDKGSQLSLSRCCQQDRCCCFPNDIFPVKEAIIANHLSTVKPSHRTNSLKQVSSASLVSQQMETTVGTSYPPCIWCVRIENHVRHLGKSKEQQSKAKHSKQVK